MVEMKLVMVEMKSVMVEMKLVMVEMKSVMVEMKLVMVEMKPGFISTKKPHFVVFISTCPDYGGDRAFLNHYRSSNLWVIDVIHLHNEVEG